MQIFFGKNFGLQRPYSWWQFCACVY